MRESEQASFFVGSAADATPNIVRCVFVIVSDACNAFFFSRSLLSGWAGGIG